MADMRVLITGGSGFIGTNLVDYFRERELEVANLDIHEPRNTAHRSHWQKVDVVDEQSLGRALLDWGPTHVIHMAARTDLRGTTIGDYAANTLGVSSLIKAVRACRTIKRTLFVSSMLVCRAGYRPRDELDYAPSTPYGESKALGEDCIRSTDFGIGSWIILRPTSIWGPWFGEPYFDFFNSVIDGRFVTFSGAATRTFGYVRNTVFQVAALLQATYEDVHGKTFYLGDKPAIAISDWAKKIATLAGVRPPRRVPTGAIWLAAKAGDVLKTVGIRTPLTSFRFRNMTTANEVDLDPIYTIAGVPPYTIQDGVLETLRWLQDIKSGRLPAVPGS